MKNLIDKIFEETGIDAVDEFVKSLDVSEKTRQEYRKALRCFMKWTELHQIEDPTKEDIDAYRGEVEALMPKGSAGVQITAVRKFYKFLARKQIHPNPFQAELYQSQLPLSPIDDLETDKAVRTDTENKVSEKAKRINPNGVYTPQEAADIFQCSVGTLREAIRKGRLCARRQEHEPYKISGIDLLEYLGDYGNRMVENARQSVEATTSKEPDIKLYTVEEVAEMAGLKKGTVYVAIKNKKLKVVHVGNRVRVTQDALDDFISRHGNYKGGYTVADVSAILRIAQDSVYGFVRRGELKALKTGGKIIISQNALNDYIHREDN